ncbi:MAG: hypothetical protein EOP86_27990 [Verrucomicrobiaceae bacterium]|nr:MAG: hypothetical protein EOP86_27990 [Verrucomicrobiaceae bacterium]
MKTALYSRRRASRASRRQAVLKVSPSLSQELIKFADLLEVGPSEFLHWQLTDLVRDLNDLSNGMLSDWAHGGVEYDTPEQTERVRQRADAWLAWRSAERDAKAVKGGSAQ